MHGYPYGPPLVSYRPLHRLPDPPGGVGGEAEAPVGVELLNGLHKPYVSLLDEVLEGEAVAAVLLGHRDDEAEVLLDEPLACALISGLGGLGEFDLLGVREQVALPDVPQVLRQELRRLALPLRLPCYGSFSRHRITSVRTPSPTQRRETPQCRHPQRPLCSPGEL